MRLIAVVGPTGTGKSDLAMALARAYDGEIINADAMQLYRGLDIGTAKATPAERAELPHHLLDVLDVTETASVAAFQRAARASVERVLAAGRTPVLVGGSGLYVQAVVDELEFPGTDPDLRAELAAELDRVGPAALHARLATVDPCGRRGGAAEQRTADRAGAGGGRADRPPVCRAPSRGCGAALRRGAARGRPAHRRARHPHRPPGGSDVRGGAGRRDPRPAARPARRTHGVAGAWAISRFSPPSSTAIWKPPRPTPSSRPAGSCAGSGRGFGVTDGSSGWRPTRPMSSTAPKPPSPPRYAEGRAVQQGARHREHVHRSP